MLLLLLKMAMLLISIMLISVLVVVFRPIMLVLIQLTESVLLVIMDM